MSPGAFGPRMVGCRPARNGERRGTGALQRRPGRRIAGRKRLVGSLVHDVWIGPLLCGLAHIFFSAIHGFSSVAVAATERPRCGGVIFLSCLFPSPCAVAPCAAAGAWAQERDAWAEAGALYRP